MFCTKKEEFKKAFTILELVVIVAIFLGFATAVFVGLKPLSLKFKDGRRVSDIQSLQLALSLYKQDNGFYPDNANPGEPLIGPNGKTYLAKIPTNLADTICKDSFKYTSASGSLSYKIEYCLAGNYDKFTAGTCFGTPSNICCQPKNSLTICGEDGCGGIYQESACDGTCSGGKCIASCDPAKPGSISNTCPEGQTAITGCKCGGGTLIDPPIIVDPEVVVTGIKWGCAGTNILGAAGAAIGDGFKNSFNILAGCSEANIAAKYCDDLVKGGYDDWYLPSRDELRAIYNKRGSLGIATDNKLYWTSTQGGATTAFYVKFSASYADNWQGKSLVADVRCARSQASEPPIVDYMTAMVDKTNICQGEKAKLSVGGKYYLGANDKLVWYRGGCGTTTYTDRSNSNKTIVSEPIGYGANFELAPGISGRPVGVVESYYVRIEGANGNSSCVTAGSVTVKRAPNISQQSIVNTQACTASSVVLKVDNPNLTSRNPYDSVKWYDAPTGGNLVATGLTYTTPVLQVGETKTYYVAGLNANGCESEARTPITAKVVNNDEVVAPPEVMTAHYCGATAGLGIAQVYSPNGNMVKWYSSAEGGTPLVSAARCHPTALGDIFCTGGLTAPTTYYAEAVNACGKASQRTPVVFTPVNWSDITAAMRSTYISTQKPNIRFTNLNSGNGNNNIWMIREGDDKMAYTIPNAINLAEGELVPDSGTSGGGYIYHQPFVIPNMPGLGNNGTGLMLDGSALFFNGKYIGSLPSEEGFYSSFKDASFTNIKCGVKYSYYVASSHDYCVRNGAWADNQSWLIFTCP